MILRECPQRSKQPWSLDAVLHDRPTCAVAQRSSSNEVLIAVLICRSMWPLTSSGANKKLGALAGVDGRDVFLRWRRGGSVFEKRTVCVRCNRFFFFRPSLIFSTSSGVFPMTAADLPDAPRPLRCGPPSQIASQADFAESDGHVVVDSDSVDAKTTVTAAMIVACLRVKILDNENKSDCRSHAHGRGWNLMAKPLIYVFDR